MAYNFDTVIDRRSTNSIKWNRYPDDVLPLWVADMEFLTPKPILDAIQSTLDQGILGYEKPSSALQESVAGRMDRLYGWKVEPEMVVTTSGVVSGFNAAAKTVCEPGEGILMQPPVYFPFLKVHKNLGLTRQYAPLVQVAEGSLLRYGIDFDAFEAGRGSNDARTRMFLFCNPHNPTGNVFNRDELSRLAEICLRNNVLVCSDEIHSELLFGGTQHTPIATLSPEIEKQSITLVAASKTFNIAGLFCGFAIISDPELRERFEKSSEQMTLHTNTFGQVAAETAFSGMCDDWLEEVLKYLTANRDFVVSYVTETMPDIRLTVPDGTYMTWLDCNPLLESGKITGSPYEFFLDKAKVALNDGAPFGPGGEGFVRLNFACPRAMLEDGLERMLKSLPQHDPV